MACKKLRIIKAKLKNKMDIKVVKKRIFIIAIFVMLGIFLVPQMVVPRDEITWHGEKIKIVTIGNISLWMSYVTEDTIPAPSVFDWNATNTFFLVISGEYEPFSRFGIYIPNPNGAFLRTTSTYATTVKEWFEQEFGAYLGEWHDNMYVGYGLFDFAVSCALNMTKNHSGAIQHFLSVVNGTATVGKRLISKFVGYISEGAANWIVFGGIFENHDNGQFDLLEELPGLKLIQINSSINVLLTFPHQNITYISGASLKGAWDVEIISTLQELAPPIKVNYSSPIAHFPELVLWRTLNTTIFSESSYTVVNVTISALNVGGVHARRILITDPAPTMSGMSLLDGNNSYQIDYLLPGESVSYSYILNISTSPFGIVMIPAVEASYYDADELQLFYAYSSENHIIRNDTVLNATLKNDPLGFPDVISRVFHNGSYASPVNYTINLLNTGKDAVSIKLQFSAAKVIDPGDGNTTGNGIIDFNVTLNPLEEKNISCVVIYSPLLENKKIGYYVTLDYSNFYQHEYSSSSSTWFPGHTATPDIVLNITRIYDPSNITAYVVVQSISGENISATFIQPTSDTNLTNSMTDFNVSSSMPWEINFTATPVYRILLPSAVYYDTLSELINVFTLFGVNITSYIYTPPDGSSPYVDFTVTTPSGNDPIPDVPQILTIEIKNNMKVGIDMLEGVVQFGDNVVLNVTIKDLAPGNSKKYNITVVREGEGNETVLMYANITFIGHMFPNVAMGTTISFRYPPSPPQAYAWIIWIAIVGMLGIGTYLTWKKETAGGK
ncbi:MAG: hypothetical protein QXL15_02800 [Candidatus Korarchaeota archaeon]